MSIAAAAPAGISSIHTGVGYAVDPYFGRHQHRQRRKCHHSGRRQHFGHAAPIRTRGSSEDAGSGAFGAAPGNVTLTAGGDVTGHYVLANGTGTITAANAGDGNQALALSLIKGGWVVNAADNIFLQEVRNPNGMFNNSVNLGSSAPTEFLFNYDPLASVNLERRQRGDHHRQSLPRTSINTAESLIFPPIFDDQCGSRRHHA